MADILWGTLGVIEEFFDAELVEDSGPYARKGRIITPRDILCLPQAERHLFVDTLQQFYEESADRVEFCRSLQASEDYTSPTMLIGSGDSLATIDKGLGVVAYFRKVLVDDPVDIADFRLPPPPVAHRALERLAQLRPLVAGGYITFFSDNLVEKVRNEVSDKVSGIVTEEKKRTTEFGYHPVLDRLAASVGLGVSAMDTTGDRYVLNFLGQGLNAVPTNLSKYPLPRLDRMTPNDLAALLRSDEALVKVHALLNSIYTIPPGCGNDPALAVEWINNRLEAELPGALCQLHHHLSQRPNPVDFGSAVTAVAATVISGVLTANPAAALAVGAAGAASNLAAAWLHRMRQHRKNAPALRVLQHLADPAPA